MQAKKFGTFAGVFTPSILTILGVIMYLRLGWVVGQAGLIATIGIILIAHLISITTGLSIASIATDKKIKAGGIYYLLSRSLGLSIGGSIGIALFVGTAFSIALYVIGFCENFLAIESIQNVTGLGEDINSYRIAGTIVIIILVVIAFISTSIAIKTQFFILGAIALSLVSIAVGFFSSGNATPEVASINTHPNSLSLITIFAIFFPAVTGFTAGVAMSGDLKDPKKSIPKGTLFAILVGLIVYLALAAGFAYFVDRDLLLNNRNFLVQIAWFSPLVIAGIWGATLSSALGGILGGPRILQAISHDRITPRIFARTYGTNNEPRNALIITFIIAEAGILIGELDIIARLVSMFYIAAYGFINLAFALEKWASSDFRPTFVISKWVGVIGFIASFLVMFRLDPLAMFIAIILLLLIYILIKRKELHLDFGDVWQSVRTSVVRSFLSKLHTSDEHARNWRPNILLFSGGTKSRPYLVQLGKYFVGNQGFISNFDLVENTSSDVLFSKQEQIIQDDENAYMGIFTRKMECSDVYQGIQTIASTYGFSGLEPNTVLMGWARQSKDPKQFVNLIRGLNGLDMNILLVDYDKSAGFGNYQKIDIWWRGGGNNGNLALSLIKFITSSHDWRNADVRLMIINPVNAEKEFLYKNAKFVVDSFRINADIIVINNEIEKKTPFEIIKTESVNTDLIFMGIPEFIEDGKEVSFIDNVNHLCHEIGTVVLIKASTYFKKLEIVEIPKELKSPEQTDDIIQQVSIPEFTIEKPDPLFNGLSDLYSHLSQQNQAFLHSMAKICHTLHKELLSDTTNAIDKIFLGLSRKADTETGVSVKSLRLHLDNILLRFRKGLTEFSEKLEDQGEVIQTALDEYIKRLDDYGQNQLRHLAYDSSDKPAKLKYRKLLLRNLFPHLKNLVFESIEKAGKDQLTFILGEQNTIGVIANAFLEIENSLSDKKGLRSKIEEKKAAIIKYIEEQSVAIDQKQSKLTMDVYNETHSIVSSFYEKTLLGEDPEKCNLSSFRIEKDSGIWQENSILLNNGSYFDVVLESVKLKLKIILSELLHDIGKTVQKQNESIQTFSKQLKELEKDSNLIQSDIFDFKRQNYEAELNDRFNVFFRKIKTIASIIPDSIELMDFDKFNEFLTAQFKSNRPVNINTDRLIDFYLQNEIVDAIDHLTEDIIKRLNDQQYDMLEALKLVSVLMEDANSFESIKNEQVGIIEKISERNNELEKDIELKIQERISNAEATLSLSVFLQYSRKYEEYGFRIEAGKRINLFKKLYKSLRKSGIEVFLSLANTIHGREEKLVEFDNKIEALSTFVSQSSPNPYVINKLPFYYKQLFLRKQNYISDLWTGRSYELDQMSIAVQKIQHGFSGGILVKGDILSGKSFFCIYAAKLNFPSSNIYIIPPPTQKSVSIQLLQESIYEHIGQGISIDNALDNLNPGSIIIFENVDQWWQRISGNQASILTIINLIASHSKRLNFIVSSRPESYQIINKLHDFDSVLISAIHLRSLNINHIRSILFDRHKTGNLRYVLNGRNQSQIRSWHLNKFFNRIRTISNGNPGFALRLWINSIQGFDNNTILLETPDLPNLRLLDYIDKSWYPLLLLLLVHGNMHFNWMEAATGQKRSSLLKQLNTLIRTGLVLESAENIYEINTNIYPFLLEYFRNKKLV